MTRCSTVVAALRLMSIFVLAVPVAAFSQNTATSGADSVDAERWGPWIGCWTPMERAPRDRDVQVCVVPTPDGRSARMTTFAGGQRILDDTIVPDGSTQTLNEDTCKGSSKSSWSRDARRLFRVTELACDGKPAQHTAGISALDGSGRWVDVQVVYASGSENVRMRRYLRSQEAPPSEIADRLAAARPAQRLAPRAITVDDVVEANAVVSHRAVEAWLAESYEVVPINKRSLLTLHDANLPTHLIDLMIARAYPKRFEVRRSGGGGGFGSFGTFSVLDDYAWMSPWDLMFDPYAFYYSPLMSYRGFIDPAYLGFGGYVTIPNGAAATAPAESGGPAHVVNGSGYTRVDPKAPAQPRPSSGDNASSGGFDGGSSSSSSGGDASASPGGYSSGGGGGGGGQTAVPR